MADYVFEGAEHAVDVSAISSLMPGSPLADGEFDVAELHQAIDDLPWWNPVGWFTDSPATRDQLAQCCEKIAGVYRNYGYLDVKVDVPERVPVSDGKVNVVFRIDEGTRYTIGESSIKGLTRYPEEVVREKSELPAAGTVAGQKTLDDAAHRIEVVVGSGDSGLADTRAALVRTESIGAAGEALGYGPLVRLSKGERQNSDRAHEVIYADCFEALIGAIYLDQGYETAKHFIEKNILVKIDKILEDGSWRDPKSYFQEIAQKQDGKTPVYHTIKEEGPDHDKRFTVAVYVGDEVKGTGIGHSKQEAQTEAARQGIKSYHPLKASNL